MKKITVFTDGSCNLHKNSERGNKGGIGVFFGDNNPYNLAIDFETPIITNQRMELLACYEAIKQCIKSQKGLLNKWELNIYTDSMFVINAITKWAEGWILWDWKRLENGKPKEIKNLDLIKKLYTISKLYPVKFHHIRSHCKEPRDKDSSEWQLWYGNREADKLAKMRKKN